MGSTAENEKIILKTNVRSTVRPEAGLMDVFMTASNCGLLHELDYEQ